jgi:cytochrome P450
LAREEILACLRTALARFPNLSLAVPFDQLKFMQYSTTFGVESLPVAW